jgi:hypothetical protein
MMGNKNKNNLQCNITVYNEAIVLESFIQNFGMACAYFPEFSAILKKN